MDHSEMVVVVVITVVVIGIFIILTVTITVNIIARSVSRKSIVCVVISSLLSGLVMNCAEKLGKIKW